MTLENLLYSTFNFGQHMTWSVIIFALFVYLLNHILKGLQNILRDYVHNTNLYFVYTSISYALFVLFSINVFVIVFCIN